jgi:type VI secretion system protein
MRLTLTIQNLDQLDNGEPTQLRLDRHGAVIGRSPHADWSLPDPKNYISSTHCEIDFRDGAYLLIDKSTNGTSINDAPQRLAGVHPIQDGDVIVIGHYRVLARIAAAGAPVAAAPAPTASKGGWGGWDEPGGQPSAPTSSGWDTPANSTPASTGWDSPAPAAAPPPPASDWGPAPAASPGWDDAPPAPAAHGASLGAAPAYQPAPAADPWGAAPAAQPHRSGWDPLPTADPASAPDPWESAPSSAISGRGPMAQNWSAPRAAQPEPPAEDVWSRFAASNSVDWTRGGFGAEAPPAAAPPPPPPPAAAPQASDSALFAAFLQAGGLSSDLVRASPAETMATAGALLRRLVSGLVVMMEARARAKAQLGAQSTTLELSGNNPLKFARSPDKVLAQLLSAPERGFMPTDRAVEDSFQDLQAHQMATLAAMQGALRATVDRFSPESIRRRAETRGLLARILPSARNAALWDAYAREFEGVAHGSDEAFLDIFAKAFKDAYEKAASDMKRGG